MTKVTRSTSSSDAENPSAPGKETAADKYRKESLTNPRFVEIKSGETLAIVGACPPGDAGTSGAKSRSKEKAR